MSLRNALSTLAAEFAAAVLQAVRTASLDQLSGGPDTAPGEGGKRPARAAKATKRGGRGRLRRSPEQIARVVSQIIGLLEKSPGGLRSEQLRSKLGLAHEAMQTPIAEALASRKVKKRGERRATTYYVGGAAPAATPASKPKKAGKKRAKGAKKTSSNASKKVSKIAAPVAKRGKVRAAKKMVAADAPAVAAPVESVPEAT